MIDQDEMDERREMFDSKIKPLIDKLYELCAKNGVSLICTSVYSRNEEDSDDGESIIVDFDGYTVATGTMSMMPDQMLALAGLLNSEILTDIAERATKTILKLHEQYENGELDDDGELSDEDQEALRMAETFSRYADALKLAGPIAFRRTANGYEFLERIVEKEYEVIEEDDMDENLANDLRDILEGDE